MSEEKNTALEEPQGNTGEETAGKTFTQEEVDKIVEKRLNRERKKFTSMLEGKDPKQMELEERENAVTKKELQLEVRDKINEKGWPSELYEFLNYTDKESCEKSIETLDDLISAAVNLEMEKRLIGGKPIKKGQNSLEETSDSLRNAFGLSNM